jgi:hypothetical protein
MAYTKTTWVNDTTPAINATNLGNIETGIFEAHTQIGGLNTQTTSYTLVLADAGKSVELNNAGATTLTVPPNSTVAFPVGTIVEVFRLGAGAVTVVAGGGVTIRSPGGLLGLRVQYSTASLRKRATDEWVLAGDIA